MRAFGQEAKHHNLYGNAISKSYQMAKKVAIAGGSYAGAVMLAENVSLVLVLWFGGSLVLKGDLSIGSLTSFLLYTQYVSNAMVSKFVTTVNILCRAYYRMYTLTA